MNAAAARPTPAPDPAAPALVWRDAAVGYGDHTVLRGVDLAIGRGEFVGLVGPNGAGKSTLLRAVTGEAALLGGWLGVCGVPAAELDAPRRARLVGVVPQALPEPFSFTAREFVLMGRHSRLGRFERADAAHTAIAERAMELTDTLRLAAERVDTLSGGDLQRLTLAQALAQEPRVLLLDEPTSHLDLNHRLQVLDLVRELADDGMAVLGVFHDLDLAARYSDRLAVVADGRVPVCGPPRDVITPSLLRDVFAVRAVVGTDAVSGSVTVTPVLREPVGSAPASGPEVFVIGGSGAAADLMRRLSLAGFRVSTGALNVGDIDQAVADVLGLQRVDLAPFEEMGESDERRVRELAARADVRVVCDVPFGRANVGNLRAVVEAGGPLVLAGEVSAERDFAGGEALALLERAAAQGARMVGGTGDVLAVVEQLAAAATGEGPRAR